MRIIKSKGKSYTRFEGRVSKAPRAHEPQKLSSQPDTFTSNDREGESFARTKEDPSTLTSLPSRGLLQKPSVTINAANAAGSETIIPASHLAKHIETDLDLTLRHFIQALDKTLRKPRSFRDLNLASYIARTLLGEALWNLFRREVIEPSGCDNETVESLRRRWCAKVHPYVRQGEVNWKAPNTDEIGKILWKRDTEKAKIGEFLDSFSSKTRWTQVFEVKIGSINHELFEKSAQLIYKHLFSQEKTISGKNRKKTKKDTGKGLIAARAQSIADNAPDPRVHDEQDEAWNWSDAARGFYFANDVAANIHAAALENPRECSDRQWFGKQLYAHFGTFKEKLGTAPCGIREIWNLHNQVRTFYRRLAGSPRFKEAIREAVAGDTTKLTGLLPNSTADLLTRLTGKKRNRDIGRLIRLGKLIAHSVDLCAETLRADARAAMNMSAADATIAPSDEMALIKAGMDYYLSSVGQGDIKRNEAFVRVLRTCVAFSVRSLRPWVDPNMSISVTLTSGNENYDLTSLDVARNAVTATDLTAVRDHAGLIFGRREYSVRAPRPDGGLDDETISTSRTGLLFVGDDSDREVLWGFVRLAALVRNRSFHFNTRGRLISAVQNGLLAPVTAQKIQPLAERKDGTQVEKEALARIEKLLSFDVQVDAHVLAAQLQKLRFHYHVPGEQKPTVLALLARTPASDDIVTPKFMKVLRKGVDLAEVGKDGVEQSVQCFSALDLTNLSKATTGANHDRVGLLRLLYHRAFPLWLEERERDADFLRPILDTLIKFKERRRKAYEKEKKAVPSWEEPFANELLRRVSTLSGLVDAFAAEAQSGSGRGPDEDTSPLDRHADPYRPHKDLQQAEAERLEGLRREVFLYLFAEFLKVEGLDWIWSITEETEREAEPVGASEIPVDAGRWEPWHRRFYAWLYLVPVDQVARLQHQFRKSKILEGKARAERRILMHSLLEGEGNGVSDVSRQKRILDLADAAEADSDTLKDIDRLMGLYTRVQTAGFGGTEHLSKFEEGAVFYESPDLFAQVFGNQVYADSVEEHLDSVPGTRRGLRNILRLGTLQSLKGIFKKHAIGEAEVRSFVDTIGNKQVTAFSDRQTLHDEIVKASKTKKRDEDRFREDCERYRQLACETAVYNFDIAAARLTEFADLHHLLVEVIARLGDFTLIWERDRVCLLLGVAFEAAPRGIFQWRKDALSFIPDPDTGHSGAEIYARQDAFARTVPALVALAGDAGQKIEEGQDIVARYFDGSRRDALPPENPKDVRVREARFEKALRRARENPSRPSPTKPKRGVGHLAGPARIRNDFLHFNVIDTKLDTRGAISARKNALNLSYLVNAVRALMSYDRKLKNAVPKAIADIVARHGMTIDWTLDRDRLLRPRVGPMQVAHMSFLRKIENEDYDPRFMLPAASPRKVSMTKALFDFGSAGYLEEDGNAGERPVYPDWVRTSEAARAIPQEIFDIIELGSEHDK